MSTDTFDTQTLRHLLKTIQYRMDKVIDGAPSGFGEVSAGHESRAAVEILSHMSDALRFVVKQWKPDWTGLPGGGWAAQLARFQQNLFTVDEILNSESVTADTGLRLIQGPLADVLTHVGQLATLRRIAGAPIAGENFFIVELPEVRSEVSP